MTRHKICLLALGGLIALSAASVRADDSALLDVLVKKGILTKQEAEKLEAEVSKEPVQQPSGLAASIKIGDWVQELDLYGDMRFREFVELRTPTPDAATNPLRRSMIRIFSASGYGSGCV